ncbi:MAG TPA: molecular chaperone [Verrucomicrobia bacterium]|nr:molecular chaperone [Verrucomicrobiota bacterium]
MSGKHLVLRHRHEHLPSYREEAGPYRGFQREMNRLFEDFFGEYPLAERGVEGEWAPAAFTPQVDVSETDTEVKVSAELPGMDEKDISIELQDDVLTLRGEKKSEQEEKGKNWFRREQSYGSFHRAIGLPAGVDASKAKATFKKGMLTFTAPKRAEEQAKRKTVPIQAE